MDSTSVSESFLHICYQKERSKYVVEVRDPQCPFAQRQARFLLDSLQEVVQYLSFLEQKALAHAPCFDGLTSDETQVILEAQSEAAKRMPKPSYQGLSCEDTDIAFWVGTPLFR